MAGTSTARPDFGLRPVLGLSLLTPNEPNPRSSIRSPAASARVIDSITSLTICSAHRRSTSGKRFAISSIKSDLVMLRILRVAIAIFQWQRPIWRRQYVPVRPPCNNPDVNQKDPGSQAARGRSETKGKTEKTPLSLDRGDLRWTT